MILRNDPATFEARHHLISMVGKDYLDEILGHSPAIVQHIKTAAQKAGVPEAYLPYLFWLIMKQDKNWPTMEPRVKEALQAARWILDSAPAPGQPKIVPPYLKIPPSGEEGKVSAAIIMVAKWCYGLLTEQFRMAYMTILRKYGPKLEQVQPDMPPTTGRMMLKMEFEYELERTPARFPNAFVLDQVINRMLN